MQIEKIGPDTVTFQFTMTHAERDLLAVLMMANVTVPARLKELDYIDEAQEQELIELMGTFGIGLNEL